MERAQLGQWFTPPDVADLAISLALDGAPPGRVADPTCGDGVFLERALRAGVRASRLVGIDIDPAAADAARARVQGADVRCGDLFDLDPDIELAAIVGNPPYVRQERMSGEQKQRTRDRLAADWPELPAADLDQLIGRGDLAVACIARCLRLVRPGGQVALVVSSALLDADYARPLWRLVSREATVLALVEAPTERWFADAAVNSMILVLRRGARPGHVAVARLSVPTAEASARVTRLRDLSAVADVRPGRRGDAARWATLLRADGAWFEVEQRAPLVPLSDVAVVRRGITSGANEAFYLTRPRAAELEIEPSVLLPLVRSPREQGASTIAIDPDATEHVAIVCDDLSTVPRARRYFGDRAEVASRPTLRARHPWWSLPANPARLFLTKAYAGRFIQRFSPRDVVADQRVYSVHPKPGVDIEALAAVLNSTYTAFALESLGRASLGEGALEWTVAGAQHLPILDPRGAGRDAVNALRAMLTRPIGPVAAEAGQPDRLALDTSVAPRLARGLPEIHRALSDSCARRATRSEVSRQL